MENELSGQETTIHTLKAKNSDLIESMSNTEQSQSMTAQEEIKLLLTENAKLLAFKTKDNQEKTEAATEILSLNEQ